MGLHMMISNERLSGFLHPTPPDIKESLLVFI